MESFISGGAAPESALKYLAEQLSQPGPLGTGEQRADGIFFPETGVTIEPHLDFPGRKQAVVVLKISLSRSGRTWTEVSVGVGAVPEQAISHALASLNLSLFAVLGRMLRAPASAPDAAAASPAGKGGLLDRFFKSFTGSATADGNGVDTADDTCTVEFIGRQHRYRAWLSDVVTMGPAPELNTPDCYWQLLKKQIEERLGDQPLVLVKLYVSSSGGEPVCECRINDEAVSGPKALLTALAEKWPEVPFASHKQYVLLEQEPDTLQPYHYHSLSGQQELKNRLKEAVSWWYQNRENEDVDEEEELSKIFGDRITACSFGMVAEICAEHAFSDLPHSEVISFYRPDSSTLTFHKVQLQDYLYLKQAIMGLLQEDAWGEETQDIFKALVLSSSTASALNSMYHAAEQSGEPPEPTAAHLLFMISPAWQPR